MNSVMLRLATGSNYCRGSHRRRQHFVLLLLFLLLLCCHTTQAAVSCDSDDDCTRQLGRTGAFCRNSACTNPFYTSGCLSSQEVSTARPYRVRVCASSDDGDSTACRPVDPQLDYTEIRILSQNWESAFLQTWILQIVLTEILGVPVSVETGTADKSVGFYDVHMPLDYGVANDWDAMERANQVGDCRDRQALQRTLGQRTVIDEFNARQEVEDPLAVVDQHISCAHVTPEIWSAHLEKVSALEEGGVTARRQWMGSLGQVHWFVPKFAATPELLHYLGLQNNRELLARTFLRPTTWLDYCQEESADNCTTPTTTAARGPQTDDENDMYFSDRLYTGYFRATAENDCVKHPDTCTGHFVDFPCDWASHMKQVVHHLGIALKGNGPDAGGYKYGQMVQIWAAANATKSPVMMQWWTPEALFQQFQGSDAAFERVTLPSATQRCVDAHIKAKDQCASDIETRFGTEEGACEVPPHPLFRLITKSLEEAALDPAVPEALRSPAYSVISGLQLSDLQLGEIFHTWYNGNITDKFGFAPREATCRWVVDNLDIIHELIPVTYPRAIESDKPLTRETAFVVACVSSCLALVFVLATSTMTYRRRARRVMKSAQVEFMYLLLCGLILVALGAIFMILPPSNGSCQAAMWAMNFGYTLSLVPLIVKMAAINRIMVAASKMRRVVLKLPSLFGIVACVMTLVVVFLVTMSVVDPPRPTTEFFLTPDRNEHEETVVKTKEFCASESEVWAYMSLSWQMLLLFFATVLAFQTRDIPEDVNESQTLAMLIYSHFVLIVMRSILYFLRDVLDPVRRPLFVSLIYSFDAVIACCIYFFPKFRTKEEDPRTMPISGSFRESIRGMPNMIRSPSVRSEHAPASSRSPSHASQFISTDLYGRSMASTVLKQLDEETLKQLEDEEEEEETSKSHADSSSLHLSIQSDPLSAHKIEMSSISEYSAPFSEPPGNNKDDCNGATDNGRATHSQEECPDACSPTQDEYFL